MQQLRALDPLLHPNEKDRLHQQSEFVGRFHTLLTTSICPPFAVSLDGLWGTGKTSIMQQIKKSLEAKYVITTQDLEALGEQGMVSDVRMRLQELKYQGFKKKDDFLEALKGCIGEHGLDRYRDVLLQQCRNEPYPVFWFNPWEYQEAESVVLAFLQRFADEMFRRHQKLARESFKILGTVGLVGLNVALKALPYALGHVIDAATDYKNIEETANRLEREYEKYDDIIETIKQEFSKLVNAVSDDQKGKPVIIMFDDLDRCLPDKTIQLLEAVKNLFVVPDTQVIFLCGIDTRIAKQFIQEHYKGIGETFAINYFRKIFNLTISMPYHQSTVLHAYLTDYIGELLQWDDAQADALAEMVAIWGAQAEMVSVRKFLNVVHNFYAFSQFNPTYPFNPKADVVVFLLLLKEAWQPLYEELVKDAIKARSNTLAELVIKLVGEDEKREVKTLRPEQHKFLHDCFVESEDFHFDRIKLGDDLLLKYPSLA